jgi:hypothetical protein
MTTTSQEPKAAPVPLALPPARLVRQFCAQENGWADHYGALHVAASYCGLVVPATYAIKGFWHHGCIGPWYEFSPGMLCSNAENGRTDPLYVARQEQADYLRGHGYARPRAIGLPIVYTPTSGVARIPGSLLVVPTHTLIGDRFPARELFERYADEVIAAAAGFSRVVVCISPNCQENGLWVKEFTERGCEIVYGARTNDANALLRMRMLFEQFETVTTNGWGSHVAYALALGARVSICGTEPERSEADYLRDTAWASNKAALERVLGRETKERERAFLQEFFVPVAGAVANRELGRWLIGADQKIPPQEMRALLAAMITPSPLVKDEPTPESVAARENRFASRVAARELLQQGRRGEAIQLLVRAVKADVASKIPLVIVESLVEIGDDLGSLEPAQAAFLADQAGRISAANGIDLPALRARLLPESAVA